MKPILAKELSDFLKRFDNFKDGEFRSIEIVSPTTMMITLAGQDSARGHDWLTVSFEFNGVSDARLLENSKLPMIDMSDGVNIISENSEFAFGVGECYNISNTKNSTCYIIGSNLKYQEGSF